jgi:hypothetical protein
MYFAVPYNVGFVNFGTFYVKAKTRAAAKGLATKRGLMALGTPRRITKAKYVWVTSESA